MKRKAILGVLTVVTLATAFCAAWASGKTRTTDVGGVPWRNSLKDALTEAKRQGKPVLLLSMFGKLDEEMPCANARTLRATLFQDADFKRLVTNDVVPAWEMVRAVPKVEIDLGDGKKIRRTVRGNAVMYLLNPDGKILDAYPGVYTASDFMPMVRESIEALAHADVRQVVAFHKERGHMVPMTAATVGKAVLESPTLELIDAEPISGAKVQENTDDPARLAFLRAATQISDLSLTPMPASTTVRRVTGQDLQGRDPKDVARQVLKVDSKTNMLRVRPVVHLWLASERKLLGPLEARDTVLETILKIPYKDPYFGLKDVLLPGTPD